MTTLAAPNTATYTTATPQEFVSVVCSGVTNVMLVSWVGPGGISGQRTVRNTTSEGEDIGPLPNNTAVTLKALAGSPTFTAPAYGEPIQALVSGGGNSAASKIFGIGSGGTAISAGTTLVTQHPAEFEFVGVRLLYTNQSAGAITVTKARIASTAAHQRHSPFR